MSQQKTPNEQQVVDFTQARAQKIDEKRRKTERIFFQQMLGVYCVTDASEQMRPLEIVEVSEDGCSFQVPFDSAKPWPKDIEEVAIRLYFSQDTYLMIHAKIQNSRSYIDKGARFQRFGCKLDQETSSYPAYQQFVRFLKLYSEHAHKDVGDATLFYL